MGALWEYLGLNVFEFMLSLLLAGFTIGFPFFQIMRAKRQRTSDLFEQFYDADHYRRVVLPVYRLIRKLDALDGDARDDYLDAIVAGWDHTPDANEMWHAFVSKEERDMTAMQQHFFVESSTEMHTEHEALTGFLYFWVRVNRMLDTKLIDEKLFKQLFCNSFAYYHNFLDLIRARVEAAFAEDPEHVRRELPSWIDATRRIERLLEPR